MWRTPEAVGDAAEERVERSDETRHGDDRVVDQRRIETDALEPVIDGHGDVVGEVERVAADGEREHRKRIGAAGVVQGRHLEHVLGVVDLAGVVAEDHRRRFVRSRDRHCRQGGRTGEYHSQTCEAQRSCEFHRSPRSS